MRRVLMAAAAAIAIGIATAPTQAATVVYDTTNYGTGTPIVISFTGVQDPNSGGTLTLTLTGTSGNDYNFTYSLLNTSSSPNTNISGFGFDVTGANLDLSTTTATGTYSTVSSGSISGGYFVDVCLTAGDTCSGGSSGGPAPGDMASGTLALEFTSLPDSFTLLQPVIRMQNTANADGSDIGLPPGAIPEPGTWGMMLLGYGAIGLMIRRRRKQGLLQIA